MSSTEFGLSNMIWAAVVVAKDGNYEVSSGKVVSLFIGLLVFHGILVRLACPLGGMIQPLNAVLWVVQNCLATRHLATFTKGFVFVNLGTTVSESRLPYYVGLFCTDGVNSVIVIVLLATTGRHNMHHASYVFGSDGIVNQTNGWNNGVAFLFGLLSVQWTVRVNSFQIRVS